MVPLQPEPGTTQSDAVIGVPERSLGDAAIPYDVLRYIPEESAEHYVLAPIGLSDGVLEVGMVDPDNIGGIDALNFIARKTGIPFKVFKISRADFDRVLGMYRGLKGDVAQAVTELTTERKSEKIVQEEGDFLALETAAPAQDIDTDISHVIQEDAPTIKIVSTILRYAIDGGASDIHIEPTPEGVRVRYRVDGELHTSVILPPATHRGLVARVKVLSSIRLDEQRKPQDGRFSATFDNRKIDFRVSTFPTHNGEKVMVRILDREQGYIPLDKIGLSPHSLGVVRSALKRPHGLVLISGPTGSGKSTTLYSMFSEIDREHQNVLSLEDPIEYYVEGMNQSQIRPEIDYTFANGLRTTLRQDPDVIMVGEIRDSETAKLAVQAALTGHLVFSTIHTNDAVGTILRLIDMGVEPYLIPPVLIASVAQRLVRTLCPEGGKEVPLSASDRKSLDMQLESLPAKYRFPIPKTVYEPQPTPTCPTGMRGRLAVFEVLEMSSEIERIILENPVESKLWNAVRSQGMLTMREDAVSKAFQGLIPFSEVNILAGFAGEDIASEPEIPKVSDSTLSERVKKATIGV